MKIEASGARISKVMDNSETLFLDACVQVSFKTADKGRIKWSRGSVVIFGLDMSTFDPKGLPTTVIGVLRVTKKNTIYKSGALPVARAFGGFIPEQWGVLIDNKCGVDIELISSAVEEEKCPL